MSSDWRIHHDHLGYHVVNASGEKLCTVNPRLEPLEDPMAAVTSRLPRSLLAQLDEARGGRSRGDVVRQALERWLRAQRRRR